MQGNYGSLFLYFTVYGISVFIAYFYQKKNYYGKNNFNIKNILWRIFIILVPTLMTGFRSIYYCGKWSDTYSNYLSFMESGTNIHLALQDTRSLFFTIINYIIFKMSRGNVTVYFCIIAFVTLYFFLLSVEKRKGRTNLALCLFLFYTFLGLRMLDQMRQLLAVTILSYSLCMLENNKIKKSIFYAILASLIHITALPIYLVFYLYSKVNLLNRKKYITILTIIIIAIFIKPIINIISKFNLYGSYYNEYFTSSVSNGNIGMGLLLDSMPLLFLILYFMAKRPEKYERASSNLLYTFFLFRYMGYFSYFIMRMCYYSYTEGIIYFSKKYEILKCKSSKIIFKICITIIMISYFLIYFYFLMSKEGMYFPYIPFWVN
ncbi:MAG: EpsG family protein [Clostridium baratii]|uniref:EpsG family protein n=1 Tax=Clostridium baratii TaxID=1561 RepID=UPI00242CF042|nr:EpsG family protein [Clostridium baratii]MBS6041959.1 EpsG family protein [Clostridium baratii]